MLDQTKQKENLDRKLRENILRDIHSETIDNLLYSYSILEKKNNSGIMHNSRVVVLIQKTAFAYLNQIPSGLLLPFELKENLPELKKKISLENLIKAEATQEVLSVHFKEGKEVEKWEFKCPSPACCKNWEKRITASIKQMKEIKQNPAQDVQVKEQVKNIEKEELKQMVKQEPLVQQGLMNQLKEKQANSMVKQEKKNQEGNQNLQVQQNQPLQQNQPIRQQNINPQQPPPSQQHFLEEKPNPFSAFLGQKPAQKPVSRPVSTFFVGGVAVQSEKDQKQLKTKIESFQIVNSKLKEQYVKKKQQESRLKQQTKRDESNLLNSIFSVTMDSKFQIQKLKKQWSYEFAKSVNQYQIIENFKDFVNLVSRKIVDQLGIEERKRYYQPIQSLSDMIKYEVHGVTFDILLCELKQVTTFQERGTIVSYESAKTAQQEFKNYDYLLRLTRNKGKLRVPLTMMLDYKGFTVFAKANIPVADNYDNMDLLQKELQILEMQSKINNNAFFEDPDNGRIVPLQSKAFEKLARAENSNRKFDICYADNLKCYLPHDFNNFNKDRPYEKLRWELIQDEVSENKVLYGDDMCSVSNRLKLPQHLRDGITELSELSKVIYDKVDELAAQLQNTNQTFTNSKQLSSIMHKYGINMRYLGVLMEKVKQLWLKEIIMSEICARCAKSFLRFDLQDCLLNLSESNVENVYKFQVKQVISFLNKMLGSSQESDTFWKQLNRQSQTYFRVSINREEVNQGYLLQAIQNQCLIRLQNIEEQVALFDSPAVFTVNNFCSFEMDTKVYDLGFTELYTSIKNLLNEETAEAYDQIRLMLNLSRNNHIPSHFRLSSLYDDLIMFLVKWLPPAQARDVYYPQQITFGDVLPSKTLYEIKMTEIKWSLRNDLVEESDSVKEWIVDHVNKWIGGAHPILSELYEIYARFYMLSKDQEKRTVNYCKSAIKNQEKLLGNMHQKLADNYYLLGKVYMNYGKKVEAINTLKKARDIIKKSENEDSEAYGEVCLRMGQLYLAINSPKQAIESGFLGFEKLSNFENHVSTIQSIELLCRCFELTEDWDSYMNLIQESLIDRIVDFSGEVELAERIIKVTILPNLKLIALNNSNVTQKLLKLISELPETTRTQNIAFNFLRQRMEERLFPQRFLQSLNDVQEVLEQIHKNGMIARWKGFQSLTNKSLLQKIGGNVDNRGFNFIATLEALNIFIGTNFIEGVLTQQ